MLVNIKYTKNVNQGFYNEIERDLTRIPFTNEHIEIDNELYNIDYINTNVDNDSVSLILHRIFHINVFPTRSNCIAISCSIQKYYPEEIINIIENKIISSYNGAAINIINGFLPKEECIRRNLDTTCIEYLEKKFRLNLINFYDTVNYKTRREEMVECAKENNAIVYIIGEIADGVKEEFELYKKAGLETRLIPLEPHDLPF
jgi:hypothetical protein